MKNGLKKFFSKAFIISILNLSLATSTTEVAVFAGNSVMGSKALIAGTAMLAIGGVLNQVAAEVVDPDNFSQANPYIINTGDLNMKIQTGKSTWATLPAGQNITGIRSPSGENREKNGINELTIDPTETKRLVNEPGQWNITNNLGKTYVLTVNYQADIIDRTSGSVSENQRPRFIFLKEGQQGTLSAGANMKSYGRNNGTNRFSYGATDSIKNVGRGTYIISTGDGTGVATGITRDTMYLEIEPSLNVTKKEIAYPLTINGATYQLYEQDDQGGTISFGPYPGKKRTLINSFVGNGGAKNITIPHNAKLLPAATRGGSEIIDPGYEIDATGLYSGVETPTETPTSFKQMGNKIMWKNDVPYFLYSIDGKELATGVSNTFIIAEKGIYIIKYTENGTPFSTKIMIK